MQVLILQQLPGGGDGFFFVFQSTTGNSQLEIPRTRVSFLLPGYAASRRISLVACRYAGVWVGVESNGNEFPPFIWRITFSHNCWIGMKQVALL